MIYFYSLEKIKLKTIPSFAMSSDLDPAEIVRNNAAEFGLYVSSVADNSIKGRMIPFRIQHCIFLLIFYFMIY